MSVLTAEAPCYTITAIDGADDDGCTLYVLHDEQGRQVTGAAWPHPLEALAEQAGFPVRRAMYVDALATDCEVPEHNRRAGELLASDLLERVKAKIVNRAQ